VGNSSFIWLRNSGDWAHATLARPRTIKVLAVGETTQMPYGSGNDDVSLDGAGTLDGSQASEASSWTSIKSLYKK